MRTLENKIPPVALTLVLAGAMWLAALCTPALSLTIPFRWAACLALETLGGLASLAGVMAFRNAQTTTNPLTPEGTSAMVKGGIYGVSRNPMYLGFLLMLAGWSVFVAHALAFGFLPLFVLYMNRFQIAPEERALLQKFGPAFTAYRSAVRRWL